jgi:hypothetical protein
MRLRYFVAGFCVALLLGLASSWVAAQVRTNPVSPTVLTGGDIGFRVEGIRGNTPVGTLVVRVNGEWVEADTAPVRPGSLRP